MMATKTVSSGRILTFIADYIEAHQYAPTIAEIGKGVGLSSKSAVSYRITGLVMDGALKQTPGVARSIRFASDDLYLTWLSPRPR